MSVAAFQRAFSEALGAEALAAGDADGAAWSNVTRQAGCAVHRNNVMIGCIDALAANFPTVARLVGDAFFRATAAEFARSNLPTRASLFDYGGGFADFLADFEPAASLPYLADVARLDRWWLEAHVAADANALTGTDLAARDPATLDGLRLRLHPSVRFGWFDQPIGTIWRRNREATTAEAGELEWRAEGVLLARPFDDVVVHSIGPAACALLAACENGATLAEATASALECESGADLPAAFAQLVRAGAFIDPEDRQWTRS